MNVGGVILSRKTPAISPILQARAKYTIRLRTKITAAKMMFKTNVIRLAIAAKSLEMPLPIELNSTPKSISSLPFVLLGLDVLMILFVYVYSAQMQNVNAVILFY